MSDSDQKVVVASAATLSAALEQASPDKAACDDAAVSAELQTQAQRLGSKAIIAYLATVTAQRYGDEKLEVAESQYLCREAERLLSGKQKAEVLAVLRKAVNALGPKRKLAAQAYDRAKWEAKFKADYKYPYRDGYVDSDFQSRLVTIKSVLESNRERLRNPTYGADLTDAELVAILDYAGAGYGVLNEALRGLSANPKDAEAKALYAKVEAFDQVLRSALDKLPDHRGFVRRGSGLPPAVLEAHQVGKTVTYAAYTSTSKGKGHEKGHRFLIHSQSCKWIEPFSVFSEEQEVLCPPGMKFKIIGRTDGYPITFVMREVLSEAADEVVANPAPSRAPSRAGSTVTLEPITSGH